MIKAVIFDLNGVLIQSEFLSARFEKEYGVPSADFVSALKSVMSQVRKRNAPSCFELWKPYLESWNVTLTEEQFFNFWFSGESVVIESLEYIKELRALGFEVFILSNNFRERTTYYRNQFPEIFENITKAYFSWETGFVKPSTESLQNIISENNLQAGEVVYFDDSKENVDVATSIGIIAYAWTNLEEAKHHIESSSP